MEWISVQNCPLCDGETSQLFDQRTFRAYPIKNRMCTRCGFVYQSPRLSDQSLDEFYSAEYRLVYQGSEEPTTKDLFVQEQRAKALVSFLQRWLPGSSPSSPIQPASVLDIGSSSGLLLTQLCQSFALTGTGVEPGAAYRMYSRQQGIPVVTSLDKLEQERYGLISMIHVLEHLPDPVATLRSLRQERLAPTGWLLVEVPNLYAHDCFEVAHLSSFSAHTLRQMLQKSGYSLVTLQQHGRPRSRVLPLYLTALARPVAEPEHAGIVKPENEVVVKRRMGMLRRRFWERVAPGLAWLPLPGA